MIGEVINNYRVVSKIGEGGMGEVFLAEHTTLGRKAAIKSLHTAFIKDSELVARFQNEAITLSVLNHSGIVVLYDFINTGQNLLIVMEYVEGTNLSDFIKSNNAINEIQAINIFAKIADAFSYAHSKGIIHRDIKPSNIILQKDFSPKVLDFGIAKIISSGAKITRTGTRMGSVAYMSPEQVLGKEVDIRTDIYSLGVMLFEMLLGKLPYDNPGFSEFEIQSKILNEPLIPNRKIRWKVLSHLTSWGKRSFFYPEWKTLYN